MKVNVYAFGSALVDIQVQVDDTIFKELSLEKGNMYLTERSRQEQVLKKLLGSDELSLDCISAQMKTAAGGSAGMAGTDLQPVRNPVPRTAGQRGKHLLGLPALSAASVSVLRARR